MNKIFNKIAVVAFLLNFAGRAHAQDLNFAARLLKQSDAARGATTGMTFYNRLTDFSTARGKETSYLLVKVQDRNARAEYLAPPKSKGDIVLMNDKKIWLWTKGAKRPLPLTPRQKLLGHAAVGDIMNTRYSEDYRPVKIEKGELNGTQVYILDLQATASGVTYDRIRYFVDPARKLGVHAEYYSVSGTLLKRADFEYSSKHGPLFLSRVVITDPIIKANRTEIDYLKPKWGRLNRSEFNKDLILR